VSGKLAPLRGGGLWRGGRDTLGETKAGDAVVLVGVVVFVRG